MLQKNIGTSGRVIRLVIGLLLCFYAYYQWSLIALIFGVFTLFEALMSWCIVKQFFGKKSCDIHKKD